MTFDRSHFCFSQLFFLCNDSKFFRIDRLMCVMFQPHVQYSFKRSSCQTTNFYIAILYPFVCGICMISHFKKNRYLLCIHTPHFCLLTKIYFYITANSYCINNITICFEKQNFVFVYITKWQLMS